MESLLYFVGFIIAIFIIIYSMDTVHRFQDGTLLKKSGRQPDDAAKSTASRKSYTYPRAKICPLCKAELEQHDVLVATIFDEVNERGKQRVLIHGCKYCKSRAAVDQESASSQKDPAQTIEL